MAEGASSQKRDRQLTCGYWGAVRRTGQYHPPLPVERDTQELDSSFADWVNDHQSPNSCLSANRKIPSIHPLAYKRELYVLIAQISHLCLLTGTGTNQLQLAKAQSTPIDVTAIGEGHPIYSQAVLRSCEGLETYHCRAPQHAHVAPRENISKQRGAFAYRQEGVGS